MASAVGPKRRSNEAGLMVIAGVVIGGAYTLASLGRSASIPANLGPFLAIVLALFASAHMAVRKFAPNADPMLLPLAVMLNGLGYVLIARLDDTLARQQSAWTALGILAFVATLAFVKSVKMFGAIRYMIGLAGVALLALPLVPGLGVEINGSRIWVSLGPFSLQPGEFAKIALAIFFAAYLVENRELLGTATNRIGPFRYPDPKHLAPILAAWGFSLIIMIYEKDLGSALLFFVLFATVLWVATGSATYLTIGFGLFGAGAYFAWRTFSHVQVRVGSWLDPWADPLDKGHQIIQSSYALAWGGMTGTGLGLGINGRIPYEESDFIFAIVGEELGLLGATAVIISFLLIVGAGYRIATSATDLFSKLLAVGLTTLIGVQAFVIMGGVTRLLPLTGVTLPFVSYGGSSLLANWILIALLMRISDSAVSDSVEDYDDAETTVIQVP